MSQKWEFVSLAMQEGANLSALCRQFGISRPTGYKILERFRQDGPAGFVDLSRRPLTSPTKTTPEMESAVLALRRHHPAWGARKLHQRLTKLGYRDLPCPSTIQAILERHGQIDPEKSRKHRPWQRFVREEPNQLWQMDFKGHFPTLTGRCHPFTALDDHSRFNLALQACQDQQGQTVQSVLISVFRQYGMPDAMLMDNGAPWDDMDGYSGVSVWLIRHGVRVTHGRPRHPQTQGKEERFHRTLTEEVLAGRTFQDLVHCQRAFDAWREVYNQERPHQALGMTVPAKRYRPSSRPFPERLPAIEYAEGEVVRKVQDKGKISFKGKDYRVGRAFKGLPVALRPTEIDGLIAVYFCCEKVAELDLRHPNTNS